MHSYLNSLDPRKRTDMLALHELILQTLPNARLWFLDGKDASGKVVSNPNIGYGETQIKYKDRTSKEFYRIGISANTSGISIYVMGLEDKNYLKDNFGNSLGKAKITGYCVKFNKLEDLNREELVRLIRI